MYLSVVVNNIYEKIRLHETCVKLNYSYNSGLFPSWRSYIAETNSEHYSRFPIVSKKIYSVPFWLTVVIK